MRFPRPSRRSGRSGARTLPYDVIAGISVAMVGLPQSLAYAELAGMPPVAGLYAGALPPVLAALFASSPYLQTGPVAITALLTFGALSTVATPGSPEYLGLGLALALVIGVVRVLLGLLRGGWLAYLMSQPMLLGFVPAAAVLISASQLPKALDVTPPDEANDLVAAVWSLAHPALWSPAALAVTAGTVLVILGGRRLHALFPGVLVATVLGIALSAAGLYGGSVVAEVPSGLLPFTLGDIPWDRLPSLIFPGVIIALIGFTEAASISRRFAAEDGSRWNSNREFISQGVANLTAAAVGGMPCGGSFSRSSVNRMSGARTRVSGAVTGLTVLAFLPFAAVLEPLPLAVLGAIVIVAVTGLLKFRPLIRLWSISPPQAAIAWTTFVATLVLAPRLDLAVLIGVALSLAVFLWRLMQLEVDVAVHEGLLTLAPRGVLWFGTAQRLEAMLLDLLGTRSDLVTLRLDLTRLGRIDTTGALVLRSIADQARTAGLEVELRGIPPQSRQLTDRIVTPGTSPLD
ncbi:SulP family inorganic anion transporter [Prauserella cavernicola]|uniref:SulP family inorganic anion transporter n=1 Tax=Prauserella cavernicola TaxID=2800127 RepID=A0A934QWT3_9PSEU|nr:SulP family inorganic anion transporter [Prauserella cavernicola]MBK1787607.1 SulP family inorganic anion transporter [Prauserella cavernicola]